MTNQNQRFLTDDQARDLRLLLAAALLDVQPKPKQPKNPEPRAARGQLVEMRKTA